jgi:hypothetical protein
MKSFIALLLCLLAPVPMLHAQAPATPAHTSTVFIIAEDGFDTDLAAAMEKKKTPITVVGDKTKADYILDVSTVKNHEESTGSKFARCLFAYCAGIEGNASVSVKLSRVSDTAVVWAYQVRKGTSGPQARQSLSEAIAKHLKNDYLDKSAK